MLLVSIAADFDPTPRVGYKKVLRKVREKWSQSRQNSTVVAFNHCTVTQSLQRRSPLGVRGYHHSRGIIAALQCC